MEGVICCVLALVLGVPLFLLILVITYASKAAKSKKRTDELARGVWSWGRQEFKKGRVDLFSLQQLKEFLGKNFAESFDYDLKIPQRSPRGETFIRSDELTESVTPPVETSQAAERLSPSPETPPVSDSGEVEGKLTDDVVINAVLAGPEGIEGETSTDSKEKTGAPNKRASDLNIAPSFLKKKLQTVSPFKTNRSAAPKSLSGEESHPLDRPIEPPEVPVPAEPRKPFHVALQTFMSEKNIHWGELFSGILIVGSALGLILSLRSQFEQAIPYFSSIMFLLLTAAMHGAGHYTLRRWKLQTTSRGVLLIASLLLPLNLLLGCLLAKQGGEIRSVTDPIYWAAILIGSGCLTGLAFAAGRCLVPQSRWAWPSALVGTSLPLLWINRGSSESLAVWQALSMVLPPIAAYFASLVLASRGRSGVHSGESVEASAFITPLLRVAGVGAFSVIGTLSFYIWKAPNSWVAVQWMGPGLALLAVAALYLGQALSRKRGEENPQLLFLESNIRIVSLVLMVVSLILGWPDFLRFVASGILLTAGILTASWCQHHRRGWALGLGVGVAVLTCFVTRGVVLVGGLPESSDLTWGSTWWSWPAALTYGVCGLVILLADTSISRRLKRLQPPWWNDDEVSSGKDEMLYLGAGLLVLSGLVVSKLAFLAGTPFENTFGTVALALLAIGVGLTSYYLRRLDGVVLWLGLAVLTGCALLFRVLPHFQPESHQAFCGIGLVGLVVSGITSVFALQGRKKSKLAWGTGFITSDVRDLAYTVMIGNSIIAGAALLPLLECASQGVHLTHALVSWIVVAIWLASGFSVRLVSLFALARLASSAVLLLTVVACWNFSEWDGEFGEAPLLVFCEAALGIWLSILGLMQWKYGSAAWLRWSRTSVVVDNVIFSSLLVLLVIQSLLQMKLGWVDVQLLTEYSITYEWFASSRWGWFVLLGVVTQFTFFRQYIFRQNDRNVLAGWYAGIAIAWSAWFSQWQWLGIETGLRFSLWSAILLVFASLVPEAARRKSRLRGADTQNSNAISFLSPWLFGALVAVSIGLLEVVVRTVETTLDWTKSADEVTSPMMWVTLLSLVGPWVLVSLGTSITFYHKVGRSVLKIAFTCGHAGAMTAALLLLAANWLSGSLLSTQLLVHAYWGWGHLALLYGGVWGLNRWMKVKKPIEELRLPAYEIGLTVVSGLIGVLNLLVIPTYWTGVTDFFSVHGLQWGAWGIACVSMLLVYRRYWAKGIGVLLGLLTAGMVAGSMVTFEASGISILFVLSIWLASMLGTLLVFERWKQMNACRSGLELFAWRVAKLALFGFGLIAGTQVWLDPLLVPEWRVGLGFVWIVMAVWLQVDYQDLVQRLVTAAVVPATVAMFLWQTPLQSFAAIRDNELTLLGLILLSLGFVLPRLEALSPNLVPPTWGRTEFKPLDAIRLMVASSVAFATTMVAIAHFFTPPSWPQDWLVVNYPGLAYLGLGVVLSGIDVASRNRRRLALFLWLLGTHSLWLLLSVVPFWTWEINLSIALLSYSAFLVLFNLFFFRSTWWGRLNRLLGWTDVEETMEWWRKFLWLVSFSWILINLVGLFTFHFHSDSRALKIAVSGSWVLSAVGLYLVALPSIRRRFGILVAGFVTGISVLWSDLGAWAWEPDQVIRLTRLILATLLATLAYGVILPKWLRSDEWRRTLRGLTQVSGLGVMLGMVVLLPLEMMLFDPATGLPLPAGQSLMVLVLLAVFSACAMVGAAVPERFGWSLADATRHGLVYVSEAFVGLVCLQAYLTYPHLFQGVIRDYWPFVLLVSSMVGAGVGHWIRSRGAAVIGLPILRTATWAPLVPILGLMWIPSQADYALVMAAIGLVYLLVLSPIHNNWNYGWISAICFNLALLRVWDRIETLSFEMHPQLWLIPPAVTVLAALQLRRKDLPEATVTLGRYFCMAVIYVSSTWEIFESGIGDSLWPPMILALLSLVGAFLGLALHVRGFVYFGTLFLLMSVVTMVAHAQKSLDHTWPWWVFGIVSGISILVFFGWLERQSDKTREWFEQWRRWDN